MAREKLDPVTLVVAAHGRATRISRLLRAIESKGASRVRGRDLDTLDLCDCDLERVAQWLERIADDVGAIPRATPKAGAM